MSKQVKHYKLTKNVKVGTGLSNLSTYEQTKNNNLALACCLALCVVGIVEPAYADWFNVGDVKKNLIKPTYDLVHDNLGYLAFAVGGAATFLARGMDFWQKGVAFGAGALGTAGGVKLAETVLHLA